jgi:hypothetical protein
MGGWVHAGTDREGGDGECTCAVLVSGKVGHIDTAAESYRLLTSFFLPSYSCYTSSVIFFDSVSAILFRVPFSVELRGAGAWLHRSFPSFRSFPDKHSFR